MSEAYTTISVAEYHRLANTILLLRSKLQKAREALERQEVQEALGLLVQESEG